MTTPHQRLDRRAFLAAAAATGASVALPAFGQSQSEPTRPEICAFIKFIQSLSYDEMAARVAEIGFDGIESTVRAKGHVLPERVKEDLPRQLEALRKHGLDLTIMTTDVVRLEDPYTEDVLRTGAALGVKKYRMGFYRYDPQRGVIDQLNEIRPQLRELAAFNKELGLTAVYQNHSGADFVGAPIWDLHYLLDGIPVEQIGVAFDIRHAMIEGGLSWPLEYDVIKPSLGAVFAKDFEWAGNKTQHVPLGDGRVDKKFFRMHRQSGIECPVSLHVEYVGEGKTQENLAALDRDYKTLCKWLDQ
ncbi:Xylose isomerase-like TIM barrel [Botrimarina colliarenosi]|uniref:Xylose isomerase-like TIM barrel n=1 Tax=Botrimarina colliarenosi TaxID=2528001 RepID=A0A5C6AHE8_9BACT|nr:sugar phosphate isomerase/epimerase family protein [Botrimarina colliarenosi]TWT99462.1 Xylose isomerase-like TIM barrel [Botrimarina colliarenosi]